MQTDEIIRKAIDEAYRTMSTGQGGPFGAAIVDPDGNIYVASNTVLGSNDPTAHAEVNAIRKACREKGTFDLSGCILYTTCYPCPMCMGAAIWSNLKEIWYGASPEDAASIGFRDDYIYDFIRGGCRDGSVMKIDRIPDPEDCRRMFSDYESMNNTIY